MRRPRLETLEGRITPTVDVTAFTGSSVTLTGTHVDNVLVLGESGDLLTHNLQTVGTGDYADASDVDPGPGTAYLPAGGASVSYTGGVYADTVALDASWTFAADLHFAGDVGTDAIDGSALTADAAFTITSNGTGTLGGGTFASVEYLSSGSGDDVFRFATSAAALPGTVAAGDGTDLLSYDGRGGNIRVNLLTNTATGASGISGFEDVTGGSGDDILHGDHGVNVLDGGGGNDILSGNGGADTLFGGAGLDMLFGGDGVDILNGGDGEDILVGSTSNWDNNISALTRIQLEWTRAGVSYAVRTARIFGTMSGGMNGPYRLNPTTVTDDGVEDSLTGGSNLDWFFGTPAEALDLGPGERRDDE